LFAALRISEIVKFVILVRVTINEDGWDHWALWSTCLVLKCQSALRYSANRSEISRTVYYWPSEITQLNRHKRVIMY